jgi:hypothetical protein
MHRKNVHALSPGYLRYIVGLGDGVLAHRDGDGDEQFRLANPERLGVELPPEHLQHRK